MNKRIFAEHKYWVAFPTENPNARWTHIKTFSTKKEAVSFLNDVYHISKQYADVFITQIRNTTSI